MSDIVAEAAAISVRPPPCCASLSHLAQELVVLKLPRNYSREDLGMFAPVWEEIRGNMLMCWVGKWTGL